MNKISVKNLDGTIEEYDLVNAFKINDISKKFAILSKGEFASTETLSKIYVTEFIETNPGVYNFIGINDEQSWKAAMSAMKVIVQSAFNKLSEEELKNAINNMTSEVDNLIKGNIVEEGKSTIDGRSNSKKVIGIDKENLIPNASGIVPLSNQQCFKKEEKIEAFNAFDSIVDLNKNSDIDSIELSKLDDPVVPENSKFIGELSNPMVNANQEILTESPINVNDFSSLSTLAPKENEPAVYNEPETSNEKTFIDMELPKMPETIAQTPETVNSNIFEGAIQMPTLENPQLDTIDNVEPAVVEKIQETNNLISIPEIIDIDKAIEEKREKLVHTVLDKLNEITAEINSCFDELKELTKEESKKETTNLSQPQQNTGDPIIGDALAYINSMQIPTEQNYSRVA